MSQFYNMGCRVEFENKIAKIYDTNGKVIGKDDQTRGNLFYLDIEDATCLVVEFDDCGYDTRGYIMLISINWLVSIT